MSHQHKEQDGYVTCPQCGKRCRDYTPEAEAITWMGYCLHCAFPPVEDRP